MQGDVVNPDPCLSSEKVGAIVAVLQHGPAVRGVRWRVARVSGTSKPEEAARSSQPLRTCVIVV